MYSEALTFIADDLPDEVVESFTEVEDFFELVTYSKWELGSSEISIRGDYGVNEIRDNLRDLYVLSLIDILGQYGVVTIINVELRILLLLARSLESAGDEINKDILSSIDPGDDAIFTVAEIISKLSELTAHDVLISVKSIDSGLIKYLLPINDDSEDSVSPIPKEIIKRYKAFMVDREKDFMYEYIASRKYLPIDFRNTFGLLSDKLDRVSAYKQAVSIMQLILASNMSFDVARGGLFDLMEDAFGLKQYGAIQVNLEALMNEVENNE